MLPTRNAVARSASSKSAYVCLGCRLRTQKRLRHDDGFDLGGNIKPHFSSSGQRPAAKPLRSSETQQSDSVPGLRSVTQTTRKGQTAAEGSKEKTNGHDAARRSAIARAKAMFDDAADQAGAQYLVAKEHRRTRHDHVRRKPWRATIEDGGARGYRAHVIASDDPSHGVAPAIKSKDNQWSTPTIRKQQVAKSTLQSSLGAAANSKQLDSPKNAHIALQGVFDGRNASSESNMGVDDRDAMSRLIAASEPTTSARVRVTNSLGYTRRQPGRSRAMARAYHTTPHLQHPPPNPATHAGQQPASMPPELIAMGGKQVESPYGIRAQLRRWQELNADKEQLYQDSDHPDLDDIGGSMSNNLTRLENPQNALRRAQIESDEDEGEAMANFMQAPTDEPNSGEFNARFLNMGDLVEVEYLRSDSPSMVAIFVRRVGTRGLAQLYTMQGRWVHCLEKRLQYSIPGWVPEDVVRPLLQHLPDPEVVETGLDELLNQAYLKDLSVPREVASPLVSRMVQFQAEATEIYRRHAGALDNAHALLAHDKDLRYGSLVKAAATLLKIPETELPVTALFAVRQALSAAGFAFNIDRRSHRLTGYLQIRSREQVNMVNAVRGWMREWQDDLALTATMSEAEMKRHRPRKGAMHVHDFLKKVKQIVLKSRELREVTNSGNVGPSKVRIPIRPGQDSVRITKEECFTEQDTRLVSFIEAWSLSNMFQGLPRIQSLPPLLLQALGLYEEHELNTATGMLLLQEIGTIMPYENRIRFDQHLLLPQSQHSRPLQDLQSKLIDMANKHDFKDSMASLRHDWGALPVYCIDDASALEIDDGLSIEPIVSGTDEPREWWVHIHIANPTAFFERDHPMAKMARHMGETIYMPERTYMMLPRWATQRHFSLDRNRPCMTFSARMNDQGETLERKIRSGYIRKALRLTRQEVGEILDADKPIIPEVVLTVGGDPPPDSSRRPDHSEITPEMAQQLRWLRMLGEKRSGIRRAAGGLFFDSHKPDVKVWQSYQIPGLAWDHPFRKGWRRVEGDPVIQLRTQGLSNWFAPVDDTVDVLVREMMLLACETAAQWCEERQIPAVFRGSLRRPDRVSPETFFEETLAPAVKNSKNGEYPMHLGLKYLETFGQTGLSTRPFNHAILGMSHYGKVTSPLRRYGDMILHWQIEAALREEARTGKSLVDPNREPDRKFLPFSKASLDQIIVGLQPRESIILRSKQYAEHFWISQLLFRAFHFGEAALPKTVKAWVQRVGEKDNASVAALIVEWNVQSHMSKVCLPGNRNFEEVRMGDIWECEIVGVDVYLRITKLKALRLLERVE